MMLTCDTTGCPIQGLLVPAPPPTPTQPSGAEAPPAYCGACGALMRVTVEEES